MTITINAVENFFLSEWLWSITWGLYHLPLAIFFMFVLCKRFLAMPIVPAVLLSFFSSLFSFVVLSMAVISILIFGLQFEYVPTDFYAHPEQEDPLHVCLYLGALYVCLHMIFFAIVGRWYKLSLSSLFVITCLAQCMAAWCVYWLLPLYQI